MGRATLKATTFADLRKLIGTRDEAKVGYATYAHVRKADGAVVVTHHSSRIAVLRPDGSVTLDSCGYHTATTLHRLDAFAPADFHISQRDWDWWIVPVGARTTAEELAARIPFHGGATFRPAPHGWDIDRW